MVHRREARQPATELVDLDPHTGRRHPHDVCTDELVDPVGILVHDEPATDLRVGAPRDDRLGALALEAAPDAVHVEGRASAATLEHRVAGLADERRHAERGAVRLLVERQGREGRSVGVAERDDIVVEARHEDPAVRVLERRDDRRERVRRVLDRAAVHPRMEIDRRSDHVDLEVRDPAQAERDRREVALEEAGVADDREVGGHAGLVLLEPAVEVRRGGLLLALEEVPQVDRQPAARREHRLGGPDVHVDLALVVRRPTGEHPAVADERLERRELPLVERVGRLDIVVPVDEHRRGALGVEPIAVHERVAAGLEDLDVLEADRAEVVGEELGRAPAVGRVLGQRRH